MEPSKPLQRKRRRPPVACLQCRRRKVKCDRNYPCAQCTLHNSGPCTYADNGPPTPKSTGKVQKRATSDVDGGEVSLLGQLPDKVANQYSKGDDMEDSKGNERHDMQSHHDLPMSRGSSRGPTDPEVSHSTAPALGTLSKTRIFGRGHWMSSSMSLAKKFTILEPLNQETDVPSELATRKKTITETLSKCKRLAKEIKAQRPSRAPLPVYMHESLPDQSLMDQLVPLYFETFESCYRILHFPSFLREYEMHKEKPGSVKPSFVMKLVLVISIAASLHKNASLRNQLHFKAAKWIHISASWLSAPVEKDRLTVDGLQVYCLLLLARQIVRVGADLVWISAGSLTHMAMQMGLHQDPNQLGKMTLLQKEVRRRLWYTILEINAQSALDSGMRPMINSNDYSTLPPSDFDDDALNDPLKKDAPGQMASLPTRTSCQCILAKSIALRLDAASIINNLQQDVAYDRIVAIGKELASACRTTTNFIDKSHSIAPDLWPSDFPYNLCDHLHRRFLLCLHTPYAVKCFGHPAYSYSLSTALKAGLDLASLLDDEMYQGLLLIGGGMFRDILTRVPTLIFLELVNQLEEEDSVFIKKRNQARKEPLLNDARKIVGYARSRISNGDTNVKAYIFASAAVAQVEAMMNDSCILDAVIECANDSLVECYELLKQIAASSLATPVSDSNSEFLPLDDPPRVSSDADDDDIDFDFMKDGALDFDLPSSCFLRQWLDDGSMGFSYG